MRAMYRIYCKEGHRQKSVKFTTYDYIDMELSRLHCKASDLYDEMQTQLDDGKIEKVKYSFYWSDGCPTTKDFNNAVALYEDMVNNYASDEGIIPYIDKKTLMIIMCLCFQKIDLL